MYKSTVYYINMAYIFEKQTYLLVVTKILSGIYAYPFHSAYCKDNEFEIYWVWGVGTSTFWTQDFNLYSKKSSRKLRPTSVGQHLIVIITMNGKRMFKSIHLSIKN